MKPTKQLGIGILIAAFAFLALAAFPPQWAPTQFQSVGGFFSQKGGALETNTFFFGQPSVILSNATPSFRFYETDAGADAKRSSLDFTGGILTWSLDTDDGGGTSVFWRLTRSGSTPLLYEVGPIFQADIGITNLGWSYITGPATNASPIYAQAGIMIGNTNCIKSYFVQTTGATTTTLGTVATSELNGAYLVTAYIVAMRNTTLTERAKYVKEALFVYANGDGSVTQQGSTQTVGTDIETTAAWDATITTAGGTDITIRVTGEASKTINWSATVHIEKTDVN